MKVDIANVTEVERRMTVEVPAGVVSAEIENAYKKLKKTVTLPGFRPGRAPVSILQRHFKAQVEEEVVGRIVQDTYPGALEEVKAEPVSQPKIENGVLERGQDFSYTAVFEVKPEIDVQGYQGLELEQPAVSVGAEDVQAELERLRSTCAVMKDIEDRPCQAGDQVTVDFSGTVDGAPYAGGEKTDFFLELKEDAFLPGFSAQIEGLAPGQEKTFSLSLPEDYFDADLAGKTIDFQVTLKTVKEKVLPALDDEFAKDVGDYAGLQELRESISERMRTQRQQEADSQVRERIFDILIEKNPFTVPRGMVDMQARNMIMEISRMLSAQGMSLEALGQSPAQLLEQYRAPAERQVRSALLLAAVAEKEGLTVADEEIDQKYEEFAAQTGQEMAVLRQQVTPDMITPQLLEKKAMDFIKAQAKLTEKK